MDDKPLHVQVAEALGWTYLSQSEVPEYWEGEPPRDDPRSVWARRLDQHIGVPRYDLDWSATGPLIEKYGLSIDPPSSWGSWVASKPEERYNVGGVRDDTPLLAACNLILQLHKAHKL